MPEIKSRVYVVTNGNDWFLSIEDKKRIGTKPILTKYPELVKVFVNKDDAKMYLNGYEGECLYVVSALLGLYY